ncbi:MAG: molecular chaperone HtpG, partial [Flavobacteriaceae bacterium]
TIENLIKKDETVISKLSDEDKEKLKPMIEKVIGENGYTVQLEALDSSSLPFVLTQPEFMRRMKEMQKTGGGGFLGAMPDMYNLVVNTNHELVGHILETKSSKKRFRLIEQALDLAKLSQNQLKGEALTRFIQRSVDLIK